jgi:hypothetical protein
MLSNTSQLGVTKWTFHFHCNSIETNVNKFKENSHPHTYAHVCNQRSVYPSILPCTSKARRVNIKRLPTGQTLQKDCWFFFLIFNFKMIHPSCCYKITNIATATLVLSILLRVTCFGCNCERSSSLLLTFRNENLLMRYIIFLYQPL